MIDIEKIGLSWHPWIGENYENGGKFGKKVLILGESHYGTSNDNWFNENLTRLTIQQKIGEAEGEIGKFYKKAFHTNIFKAFNEKPPTNENVKEFWHSVAYFNYVQGSVGAKARVRPTNNDWKKSFKSVLKTLEILKPDIIVVLGYKLWDSIWNKFETVEIISESFNKNRNVHKLKFLKQPLFFCVKHPSAGFSSNHFRPHILKYIYEK